MKNNKKTAFTLVELSIVLIIIGLIVTGVVAGGSLVEVAKVSGAKSITKTSPVLAMEDLSLWIEATTDESFNDVVPSDGDAVSGIDDINPQISTGAGDATQGTPANQPAFATNVQNGLPMMRFETGDFLDTSITYSYVQPLTLFVVANSDDYSGDFLRLVTQGLFPYVLGASESGTLYSDSNGGAVALDVSVNQAEIYAIRHNGIGSTTTYYKNGVSESNSNVFNVSDSSNPWRLMVEPSGGYIGEVIMFKRALSDADVAKVNNYLSTKWGIAL